MAKLSTFLLIYCSYMRPLLPFVYVAKNCIIAGRIVLVAIGYFVIYTAGGVSFDLALGGRKCFCNWPTSLRDTKKINQYYPSGWHYLKSMTELNFASLLPL